MQEASAAFAHDFVGAGVQRTGVPELADHAGRLQPRCGVRREGGGEVLVPPEVGKLHAAERNAAGGRVQASGRRWCISVLARPSLCDGNVAEALSLPRGTRSASIQRSNSTVDFYRGVAQPQTNENGRIFNH
jgi:hypothetical protein